MSLSMTIVLASSLNCASPLLINTRKCFLKELSNQILKNKFKNSFFRVLKEILSKNLLFYFRWRWFTEILNRTILYSTQPLKSINWLTLEFRMLFEETFMNRVHLIFLLVHLATYIKIFKKFNIQKLRKYFAYNILTIIPTK